MSGFDTTLLGYHVRRLDADSLAALVADLWSARGYETAREDGAVVARHGTEAVRIRVAPGPDTPSTVPADVVVTTGGHDSAGARVVDETALAEMLGYAVDRSVARELCERHLGDPPGDLAAPPGQRLRGRTRTALGSVPVLALLLGAVAVAVVLASVAGLPSGDTGQDGPADGELDTVAVGTASADSTGAAGEDRPASEFPPGVTAAGIEDVEALARAHYRATANRSHTVWVDWYRPERMQPDGTLLQRDIDVATDGDRYLIRTSLERSGNRTRGETIYYDGDDIYVAGWNDTAGRYDRPLQVTSRQVTVPTPGSLRVRVVREYLSTPETSVAGVVERDGTRLYRVRGQGRPNVSWDVAVTDYSVEALVDPRGRVHEVSMRANVSYPRVADNSTIPIRRTITYGRVDTTTVDPPVWYENYTRRG